MIGSERAGIQRGGVRKVEWAPGNSLAPSWRNGCVVSLQRNDGLWGPPHATRSQSTTSIILALTGTFLSLELLTAGTRLFKCTSVKNYRCKEHV